MPKNKDDAPEKATDETNESGSDVATPPAPANLLSALEAAELAAAAAPLLNVLTNLANGDGSAASIEGQGIVLEGEYIAILPTLKKIGVNLIAQYLITQIQAKLASLTPSTASSKSK